MWYATIVGFDPVSYLEQIDIPIFWILGDPNLDQLGPVEKSIATLETFKQGGKSYEIMQFEGEGHNVKESKYELPLYNWLKGINNYRPLSLKSIDPFNILRSFNKIYQGDKDLLKLTKNKLY